MTQIRMQERKVKRSWWPLIGFLLIVSIAVISYAVAPDVIGLTRQALPRLNLRGIAPETQRLVFAAITFLILVIITGMIVAAFAPRRRTLVKETDIIKDRDVMVGFTDGLAPAGAWVAITGTFWLARDVPAWLLLGALTLWIGGFDLLYACQDAEFDRREGLHSIPARFGVPAALNLARLCHLLTVALLAAVGAWFQLGWLYWVGLAAISGLFIWEHSLVKPNDLSKLDMAFFNINGYISLTIFVATVLAVWLR